MKPSCSVSLLVCCLTVFFFNLVGADTPSFACDVDTNPWVVNFTFCDQRVGTAERVADLVKRMNLYEKKGYMVSSAVAVPRLGIPKYQWWSETVNEITHIGSGTRFSDVVPSATSFPKVILTAASFNTSLFEAIGKAVSTEARAMYNVGLSGLTFWTPDVNIARDPRFGRIRDTPGEDPVLAGKYATAYVKGLQQTDDPTSDRLKVAACCKHYTAYDVNGGDRTDPSLFNAVVTQQDMEDTLLPPFKSCVVDGKVASVMCSYNQVNGKPACADPDLLSGLIRGQWNLNGYIVTDCDAIDVFHNFQRYTKTAEEAVALAIKSGVDLNCGNFIGRHSEVAVWTGLIEEADIDNAVTNNLATLMRLGFFDGDPRKQAYGNLGPEDVCSAGSQEIALEAARQGIVLLKNSPGSLPLSVSGIKSLAVIGPTANVTTSLTATPCKNFTPLQGLSAWVSTVYSPGCDDEPCGSAQLAEAAALAASADATVLIMGFDQYAEAEMLAGGVLTLPSHQNQLITAATDAAKGPVILVIMSAAGKDVRFAKDHPKVTSILWVGYPGEAGGTAIADVIFGAYNPSGRLPISWYPQSYADTVSMKDMNMRPDSNSGYPGRTYRFYTGDDFVYNFGDGLSYTNFHYQLIHAPNEVSVPLAESHECRFAACVSLAADAQICRNLGFDLDLKVRNEGWMDGSHAVLLFSSPPSVHRSPRKHLVGFEKVYLAANTEAAVRMRVDVCEDLGVVDEFGARKVALGEHVLQIGDLKHSLNVRI